MPVLLIALFLMVLLEGTITTIPVSLVVLILIAIKAERTTGLGIAFTSGIFLDLLRVRVVGQTSLLLVTFLFFIFLYERKYEINTLPFVVVATFAGSMIYGLLFQLPLIVISSFITVVIAVFGFFLLTRFSGKKEKPQYNTL